jgi:hypothetical protein
MPSGTGEKNKNFQLFTCILEFLIAVNKIMENIFQIHFWLNQLFSGLNYTKVIIVINRIF